jgi:hypothetical protein
VAKAQAEFELAQAEQHRDAELLVQGFLSQAVLDASNARKESARRARGLMGYLEIEHRANSLPASLSGGATACVRNCTVPARAEARAEDGERRRQGPYGCNPVQPSRRGLAGSVAPFCFARSAISV